MASEKIYSHRSFLWENSDSPASVTAGVEREADGDLSFGVGLYDGYGDTFSLEGWRGTGAAPEEAASFGSSAVALRKIHSVIGEVIAALEANPFSASQPDQLPGTIPDISTGD